MNCLNRTVSIYPGHRIFLRLWSPSTKIMGDSRGFSSGDGRSPNPKNNTTSFSSDEEQFPPLGACTKRSGRRSEIAPSSANASSPVKSSSESQNWESSKESKKRDQSLIRRKDLYCDARVGRKIKVDLGSTSKDALSSQRNSVCKTKNRDQSWRRPPTEFYVAVGRRSDTSVTYQIIEREAKEPTGTQNGTSGKDDLFTEEEATSGTGFKHKGYNNSVHDSSSLFTPLKHPGWKNRDQRRQIPRFDISSPLHKGNNRSVTEEEADWPTSKHNKGNHSRTRQSTDGYTQHPQSQDWRIREDGFSPKWNPSPKWRPFDICSSSHKRNNSSIKEADDDKKETEQQRQTVDQVNSSKHKVLRPGMVLLKHYLTLPVQVDIVKTCRQLGLKPQGFYQPGYTAGSKLRLQMMCLGRNWDPQTKYANNTVTDKIPETFSFLVEQAIREAQALIDIEDAERILPSMSPDICIVNFYTETGRLGLHQDRDESRESIRKGLPIVSFSIGDSAEFLYGDDRDVEKAEQVTLESGDVLIFGRDSRMVFHGVKSIIPNSAPMSLLDESKLRFGRLNLTFRHF